LFNGSATAGKTEKMKKKSTDLDKKGKRRKGLPPPQVSNAHVTKKEKRLLNTKESIVKYKIMAGRKNEETL